MLRTLSRRLAKIEAQRAGSTPLPPWLLCRVVEARVGGTEHPDDAAIAAHVNGLDVVRGPTESLDALCTRAAHLSGVERPRVPVLFLRYPPQPIPPEDPDE